MTEPTKSWDVIVVGAGLAGLRAARDLAEAGRTVLLLESRDRVGGRGWTGTFPGTDAPIELGGSWFTKDQTLVPAELDRYGLGRRTFPAIETTRWRVGGRLVPEAAFDASDTDSVNQWQRLQDDAHAADSQPDDPRWTTSLDDYLTSIDATESIRDLAYGWWSVTGGGVPSEGCVEGLLGAIQHDTMIGDASYLALAPTPGWSALAAAMAATSGVEVRLNTSVTRITQHDEDVVVATQAEIFTASSVVIAVPVNVLPTIDIEADLPPQTRKAFGRSAGRAIKVWMHVRGVSVRSLAYGVGDGLNWLYGDREVDGATLVIGFGWPIDGFDPSEERHIERALHAFYPDAELLAFTTHDWLTDRSSLGTWVNTPAGEPTLLRAENFAPTARLFFATSDIAERDAGWFEGALVSGAAAAQTVLSRAV